VITAECIGGAGTEVRSGLPPPLPPSRATSRRWLPSVALVAFPAIDITSTAGFQRVRQHRNGPRRKEAQ
jgi:hypothetical protein